MSTVPQPKYQVGDIVYNRFDRHTITDSYYLWAADTWVYFLDDDDQTHYPESMLTELRPGDVIKDTISS